MSSYILIDTTVEDNTWWKDLIQACAVLGDVFEIHCWSDESDAAKLALRYGRKVTSTWRDGTVILGTITKEFLSYLTRMPKPSDTEIYNKMTPFFTIRLGGRLYSEHYGTEVIISKVPEKQEPCVDRILNRVERCGTVHRNVQ